MQEWRPQRDRDQGQIDEDDRSPRLKIEDDLLDRVNEREEGDEVGGHVHDAQAALDGRGIRGGAVAGQTRQGAPPAHGLAAVEETFKAWGQHEPPPTQDGVLPTPLAGSRQLSAMGWQASTGAGVDYSVAATPPSGTGADSPRRRRACSRSASIGFKTPCAS